MGESFCAFLIQTKEAAMAKGMLLAILLFGYSAGAQALDSWAGHVTILETTYMPTSITFTLDTGSATCPAGVWLTWSNANIDNNKAAYALLLAANVSGLKIAVFANSGDTTCTIQFLHGLATA
jgi:hypothetical protein